MAQEGKISFIGLANWDEDLFENMCWPDPFNGDDPVLNRQAFLYELLARTAELEVIYTDPDIMKGMIGFWSTTRCLVWNELWATTTYEYNPIENYNRIEDGTDKDVHTGQNTDSHAGQDTETHSGTDSYADTVTHAGTDTNTTTPKNEHYVAGYNPTASGDDDGLLKQTRDEGETVNATVYGSTDSKSGSQTYGNTKTNGYGSTITHGYGDTMTRDHDLNVHGNIGTVTTQKMIQEQREIVTFNFYDVMIRDFIERFCILVY